jgi:hypothetical protein
MKVNKIFSAALTIFSLILLILAVLRLNYWGALKADLYIRGQTVMDVFYITLILTSILALAFSGFVLVKIIRVPAAVTTKWIYFSSTLLILVTTLGLIASSYIEANFIQAGLKKAF